MALNNNTGKCNLSKAALINIFVLMIDQMYYVKKYTQLCICAQLFGVFWHLLAFSRFVFYALKLYCFDSVFTVNLRYK